VKAHRIQGYLRSGRGEDVQLFRSYAKVEPEITLGKEVIVSSSKDLDKGKQPGYKD